MLRVGLTGNIASGKTNARGVFAELGAHTIDADEIAHSLLAPDSQVGRSVLSEFGEAILRPDGTICRKTLGMIVFHDPERRQRLNSLVHPGVMAEVWRRIGVLESTNSAGIIIIDSALMIETGSYRSYDRVVLVYCNPALQLDRLIRRDRFSPEEARLRIAAQTPVEEKLKVVHYRIDTSGTLGQTRKLIEAIYRDLVLYAASRCESPND